MKPASLFETKGKRRIPERECRRFSIFVAVFLAIATIPAFSVAEELEVKINGIETNIGKLETGTIPAEMKISPDGKRLLQLVVRDEQYFVVLNEQTSPAYDGVTKDSLRFSPDGKRYCYGARIGDRKFVVVDGIEYPAFDGSAAGMPVFSPDSQHFAYVALRGGKQCVVRDGEPGPDFEMVSSQAPMFSPDSQRLAYLVKDGDRGLVVLDGKPGERFRNIAAMTFSPDSRHFAYAAISLTTMSLILDDQEIYRDERFVKDSLAFDGSESLHVLVLRDRRIVRARFDLMSLPRTLPNQKTTPEQ